MDNKYTRFRGGSSIWSDKTISSNIVNEDFWGGKNTFWIKVSGVWKQCITWIKVSGVWKQSNPKININDTWR